MSVEVGVGVGVQASTESFGGVVPPHAEMRNGGEDIPSESAFFDSNTAEYLHSVGIAKAEYEEFLQEELAGRSDVGSGLAQGSSASADEPSQLSGRLYTSDDSLVIDGTAEFETSSSIADVPGNEPSLGAGVLGESATSESIKGYPHIGNDDLSTERIDGLDVTQDALAFARVATSTSVTPPLAVGVFGTWGSGKSYFMELIRKEIQRISDSKHVSGEDALSPSQFHRGVIQVRFNAWHYAESNLWASLVGHIFQELSNATTNSQARDEVLGRLSTARTLTIDAAESLVKALRAHAVAEDSLENAKLLYAEAQARDVQSGRLFFRVLKDVVHEAAEDPDVQKAVEELNAAASDLRIEEAVTAQNMLTDDGLALMRDGVEVGQVFNMIARKIGSWRRACVLLALMVAIPVLLVMGVGFLLKWVTWLSSDIKDGVTAFIAVASTLSAGLVVIARPVIACLKRLKKAQDLIQKHIDGNKQKYEDKALGHKATVTRASAAVETAGETWKATSARLAALREELHGQSSASRLINFIRARASDGEYAKHLGIVSTIRKDFEQLSRLLSEDKSVEVKEDPEEQAQFQARVDSLVKSALYKRRKHMPIAPAAVADGSQETGEMDVEEVQLLSDSDIKELESLGKSITKTAMPFNRIVLYIDDVDRCPPNKVVEVLQAVHMLLAFRLFVVFVAVDVRWVSSSLVHEYREMLKDLGEEGHLTSASDYLEKIIQIPYWIPLMTKASSKNVFDSHLMRSSVVSNQQLQSNDPSNVGGTQSTAKVIADQVVPNPTQLEMADVTLLRKFSVIIDSPRKMNRFINVVLFLKARGVVKSGPEFIKENTYLFAQVALATAAPQSFKALQTILRAARSKGVSATNIVHSMEFEMLHPRASMILDILDSQGYRSLHALMRHEAWPARLSFSTPTPYTDIATHSPPVRRESLNPREEELLVFIDR